VTPKETEPRGDDPDVGGADALAHIDEDVALLVATNQNAYRFPIEWARIYPTRAAFDASRGVEQQTAARNCGEEGSELRRCTRTIERYRERAVSAPSRIEAYLDVNGAA
jgi:hypothetical protein